jgi:hypothetical protein
MIADGLRLYATRPSGKGYEEVSRGLLSLQIGLALYSRHQLLPGPRRGWGVAPPDELNVERADGRVLEARGTFRLLPPGDRPDVPQAFRFSAERTRRGWRHVLLTLPVIP